MHALWPKLALSLSVFLAACGGSEDGRSRNAANVAATPTPAAAPTIDAAPAAPEDPSPSLVIASVRLAGDCPTAPASSAAPAASAGGTSSRGRQAFSISNSAPCTQSTLQLALSSGDKPGQHFNIQAVRLTSTSGSTLTTMSAREPTRWNGEGYSAWDGSVDASAEHLLSYKLSAPNWKDVEVALGKSSYESMYIVEVDAEYDGKTVTLKSPQVERTQPLMIRT